ncbi:MAG: hypothetical protein V4606_04925 [Patescibacteria group bacterium]
MLKWILAASFIAVAGTASANPANCIRFENNGYGGQNVANYCNEAVILEWRSTHGPCSSGQLCGASVAGRSQQGTSNPAGSGASWSACWYDDWVNGYCTFN